MWWPLTPRPHQVRRPLQPLVSRLFRSSEAGGRRPGLTDEGAFHAGPRRAWHRSFLPSGGVPVGRAQRTRGSRSRASRPALRRPVCGVRVGRRERRVQTIFAANFRRLLPRFSRPDGRSSAVRDASPGPSLCTAVSAASYSLMHPKMLLYLLVDALQNYHMSYQQIAHSRRVEVSNIATCVSPLRCRPMCVRVMTERRRMPRRLNRQRAIHLHLAHSDAHRTATQHGQRRAMRLTSRWLKLKRLHSTPACHHLLEQTLH